MSLSDVIQLDRLLSPIAVQTPTGSDLREDSSPTSDYQKVKASRAAARAAERNSIHDGDNHDADQHWRTVIDLAPGIIASQSKDLEVASWLTEALLRHEGFIGLCAAFQLIEQMLEVFWDELYPMPDEDGLETRTAPLAGLNGEGSEGVLIAPLRKVPITEAGDLDPFCLWQYQQALEADRAPDEETRAERVAKLGFSMADIEKAVAQSSSEFFSGQLAAIEGAITSCQNMNQLLDQHCGPELAPSLRTITDVLEECRRAISHIAQSKLAQDPESAPDMDAATSEADPASAQARMTGPIKDREQAFRQLSEISRFFLNTEPHSPVAYVLEKAVRWGRMSLDELIVELIPDDSSRRHFGELTGIQHHHDD